MLTDFCPPFTQLPWPVPNQKIRSFTCVSGLREWLVSTALTKATTHALPKVKYYHNKGHLLLSFSLRLQFILPNLLLLFSTAWKSAPLFEGCVTVHDMKRFHPSCINMSGVLRFMPIPICDILNSTCIYIFLNNLRINLFLHVDIAYLTIFKAVGVIKVCSLLA